MPDGAAMDEHVVALIDETASEKPHPIAALVTRAYRSRPLRDELDADML